MKSRLMVFAALLLGGCTLALPVLTPNAHLQQVGEAQARREIWQCTALADQLVRPTLAEQIRHDAVSGYRKGEAVHGVMGWLIYDHPARPGALGSDRPTDDTPGWRDLVSRCLQERGYEVVGWTIQAGWDSPSALGVSFLSIGPH